MGQSVSHAHQAQARASNPESFLSPATSKWTSSWRSLAPATQNWIDFQDFIQILYVFDWFCVATDSNNFDLQKWVNLLPMLTRPKRNSYSRRHTDHLLHQNEPHLDDLWAHATQSWAHFQDFMEIRYMFMCVLVVASTLFDMYCFLLLLSMVTSLL